MTTTVFLAVIFAAFLHAFWNALLKHGADKYLSMTGVTVGSLPVAVLAIVLSPLPLAPSWPYVMGAMVLHLGYQIFLLTSYRFGDLTQVYPIARGVAPLIVAGFSILVLGVELTTMEIAGIAVIGAGLMSLVLVRSHNGARNGHAATLAIVTGCFIAAYTLNDGTGARLAGNSLAFYGWASLSNGLLYALVISVWKPGMLKRMVVEREGQKMALVGGTTSFAAYAIVTWAFTQAPIAIVAALRESSIIIALLLGTWFLGERFTRAKLVATVLTLVGAVLLRLA